jgi:hypothetical protein
MTFYYKYFMMFIIKMARVEQMIKIQKEALELFTKKI